MGVWLSTCTTEGAHTCRWVLEFQIHRQCGRLPSVNNPDIASTSGFWCTSDRCWAACITSIHSRLHWADRIIAEHRDDPGSACGSAEVIAMPDDDAIIRLDQGGIITPR